MNEANLELFGSECKREITLLLLLLFIPKYTL